MPYTRVTSTPNGAEAIQYASGNGMGHNGAKERNKYVTGINLLPDNVIPFENQMQPYWNKARTNHKIQIRRYIISFSEKEADPGNPADIYRAHQAVCHLGEVYFPGRQIAVYTQTDGAGGKVHAHMLVNDVHRETLKGVEQRKYNFDIFSKEMDEILAETIDLDIKTKTPDREPQAVRGKKHINEKIREANAREIEAAKAENREPDLQPEIYIWKEDLKTRIRVAAAEACDENSFLKRLTAHGVEGERRKATKKQPEHYVYELIDTSGFPEGQKIPPNLKSKSFKLGDDYQPEGVVKMFQELPKKAERMREQENSKTEPLQKQPKIKSMRKTTSVRKSVTSTAEEREQGRALAIKYIRPLLEQTANLDAEATYDAFLTWRAKKRKEGKPGLRPIYKKDQNGIVSLIVDALNEQFLQFLGQFLHDMEEKKRKLEEQRRWHIAMAEELLSTVRESESKKGKDDPDGPNR